MCKNMLDPERPIEIVVRMAQQVQVSFVDDLDGSVADSTVSFVLDKASFEIDLSEANAAKLRNVFGPYIDAARRSGGNGRSPSRSGSRATGSRSAAAGPDDTKAIREWAESQGMTISARGRLSSDVKRAYAERAGAPAPEPTGTDATAAVEPAAQTARGKAPGVTFSGAE